MAPVLGVKPGSSKESGTRRSGYIETGAPTFCGNCDHIHFRSDCRTHGSCDQADVKADPEVGCWPDGKKKVAMWTGCCKYWWPIAPTEHKD